MFRVIALTTLVVLSVAVCTCQAALYSAQSEVRVARGNNSNQYTVLYWHRNQTLDNPSTAYSTLTDYGSFYNTAPGEGANTSNWSGRAAAQSGPGFLRVYSEIEALTVGPSNKFTTSYNMAVNGNLEGLVTSDGTVRVVPNYITGGRAEFADTITPNATNPSLLGEAGSMRIDMNMNGFASYSQGFYEKLFGGNVISEATLRITVGGNSNSDSFTLEREFYWDYDSKPFADSGPMGGTVSLQVPIVFGDSYSLKIEMWGWSQIAGYGSIGVGGDGYSLPLGMHTVIADYHNTATWDGVTLFDEFGTEVAGSATVDGQDYTNAFTAPTAPDLPPPAPVPEPGTLVLLAVGFGGLIARVRHRRR